MTSTEYLLELDTFSRFVILKLMLDDKDIQKLIEVFATREELKEMISRLVTKEEFSNLQTAIDAYAKRCDDYFK